ncbi:uncharacterized protein PHACADRAFT_265647 [Phanerochaete carnosa HHB-10118-sp]|uniref:Major facilitator superfamily (MFS) profile domain-containing protein n=1 Tax=Phanerochaete carnosa (strain HHB-10118-sp) TaxID=650164 RepID=K5VFH6_PHACS|nr:uncharacterized protein PHACADRAFT_265647 [Phanerochaete carnosa HHB-10118-sp]EKM49893.1 hypothetical protein PHACADRAFT_265647 [Phanerochaete carnosa HHB-10118-sp]
MAPVQPLDLEPGHRISIYSVTSTTMSAHTYPEKHSLTKEVEKGQADEEYPDGGWRAWLTVLGAFFALFCTFGQLSSFGTFQSWYSEHQLQDLSPSTISWIGSLQLWVFFFSGGFVGRFFDVYGPRVIMIPGTLVLVVSIMITSVCQRYYEYILAQGILFGLGVGMLFYPSLSAVSTHFKKYRATALGIALSGSGVGGVVYPTILQRLFIICGYGWGVRIAGFICLLLCAIACCTVSSRLERNKTSSPWFDTKHLRDTRFVLLVIGSMFVSLGLFIPNFYIVSYAVDHGVSTNTAFYVLAVLNGGGILGRIVPAWLSDALGRFNVLVPAAACAGLVTLVGWPFAGHGLGGIMGYAAAYGFFSGAFNALIVPCIAQISDIKQIGTRIGMLYSILSFPALAGGPAAGALLKAAHGSYIGMIIFSGATILFGSFFYLWVRLRIDSRPLARV